MSSTTKTLEITRNGKQYSLAWPEGHLAFYWAPASQYAADVTGCHPNFLAGPAYRTSLCMPGPDGKKYHTAFFENLNYWEERQAASEAFAWFMLKANSKSPDIIEHDEYRYAMDWADFGNLGKGDQRLEES